MKLLIIAPGYPPEPGGVETHVGGLATELAAIGTDVEVWAPQRHTRARSTAHEDGVVVRRFPSNASTRFQVAPLLYRHARRHLNQFDLVHTHSFHNAAAAAVLCAGTRTQFVFTPHYHGGGHTRLASLAHRPYRAIGNRLFAGAGRVIAVSMAEQMEIVRAFPDVEPKVIHNAVDVDAIRHAAPFRNQPPTALVMGRIEHYKHINMIAEAFDRLDVDGQLVITGDGPARGDLESAVARMRRSADVKILGFISRHDLHRWLRTARTVVSMSSREAFGLVALEAVSAGASAILSDLPAHREVRELAPTRISIADQQSLADVLMANLAVPNVGPTPVRTWSEVAREHDVIYHDVLAGTGGR